ncbi:MAG: hypothetical protein AAF570_12000, partial [Bacteroidota bacterium]
DAGWSLHDGTDIEKTFCCLNARARDFARFGVLYLNKGNWKGEQLVPEDWVEASAVFDTVDRASQRYQYQWYTSAEQEEYYGQGMLGQFTYICPSSRTVIVRLGNSLDYLVPWYDNFKVLAHVSPRVRAIPMSRKERKRYTGNWLFGESHTGDTILVGKVAKIRLARNGLKVRTDFNKTWKALPDSPSRFFNLRFGRRLRFRPDPAESADLPTSVVWTRRGNSWTLYREGHQPKDTTHANAQPHDSLQIPNSDSELK